MSDAKRIEKGSETLSLLKVLKDGRVKAVHRWRTGGEVLIFASLRAFERVKHDLEVEGVPLPYSGYTVVAE